MCTIANLAQVISPVFGSQSNCELNFHVSTHYDHWTAWSTASLKLNRILLCWEDWNKLSNSSTPHNSTMIMIWQISNLHQDSVWIICLYLWHDLLWLKSNFMPLHWFNPPTKSLIDSRRCQYCNCQIDDIINQRSEEQSSGCSSLP